MSEDHVLNCRQTHLYRVMRHDAIVCWLYDYLVSRKKYTVTHEQKTWVEQARQARSRTSSCPTATKRLTLAWCSPGPQFLL